MAPLLVKLGFLFTGIYLMARYVQDPTFGPQEIGLAKTLILTKTSDLRALLIADWTTGFSSQFSRLYVWTLSILRDAFGYTTALSRLVSVAFSMAFLHAWYRRSLSARRGSHRLSLGQGLFILGALLLCKDLFENGATLQSWSLDLFLTLWVIGLNDQSLYDVLGMGKSRWRMIVWLAGCAFSLIYPIFLLGHVTYFLVRNREDLSILRGAKFRVVLFFFAWGVLFWPKLNLGVWKSLWNSSGLKVLGAAFGSFLTLELLQWLSRFTRGRLVSIPFRLAVFTSSFMFATLGLTRFQSHLRSDPYYDLKPAFQYLEKPKLDVLLVSEDLREFMEIMPKISDLPPRVIFASDNVAVPKNEEIWVLRSSGVSVEKAFALKFSNHNIVYSNEWITLERGRIL